LKNKLNRYRRVRFSEK